MKTIPEILNITPDHYEQRLLFNNYFLWCDLNAPADSAFQNLLANPTLFRWWLGEYQKLEYKFITDAGPYLQVATRKELLQLYVETTIKIRDYYPKPLIEQAIKRIINPELN